MRRYKCWHTVQFNFISTALWYQAALQEMTSFGNLFLSHTWCQIWRESRHINMMKGKRHMYHYWAQEKHIWETGDFNWTEMKEFSDFILVWMNGFFNNTWRFTCMFCLAWSHPRAEFCHVHGTFHLTWGEMCCGISIIHIWNTEMILTSGHILFCWMSSGRCALVMAASKFTF